MSTISQPRHPRGHTRTALVKEMWATMTQSREDKQYATASLTGERLAKILGDWPEKGQAAVAVQETSADPEVIVYSAKAISAEEWDAKFERR